MSTIEFIICLVMFVSMGTGIYMGFKHYIKPTAYTEYYADLMYHWHTIAVSAVVNGALFIWFQSEGWGIAAFCAVMSFGIDTFGTIRYKNQALFELN